MRFSEKSGFGRIPPPPISGDPPDDLQAGTPEYQAFQDYCRLHTLLSNATAAEIVAVRRISIAQQITRLNGGGIASAGNTSCLLQETTLGTILPPLPQDCSVIIIKRQGTSSRMKSTKYKRSNIQDMITLLKKTGHPAWEHIELSRDNLMAWDEDGDLADTLSRTHDNVILERDENGDPVTADVYQPNADNPEVDVLNDGGDIGPAPLQNDVIEEETFEGVVHFGDNSAVSLENAHLAAQAVTEAAHQLRADYAPDEDGDVEMHPPNEEGDEDMQLLDDIGPAPLRGGNDSTDPPVPNINNAGTSATLRHEDVYTTVGYADMLNKPWAFAQAFPSLFIPRYCKLNGVWAWRIFHDYKGWDDHRDKDVDFNSWLALQTWRSDGEPAAHSTFGLIAVNLKMKTALVKQGLYCLNTSGMDLATTAEDIKNSVDNDELQQQIKELVKRYRVNNYY